MKKNSSQQSYTICISGVPTPGFHCPPEGLEIGRILGHECAEKNVVVTTTATSGFPLWVALAAQRDGATTLAFSPATSLREHTQFFKLPDEGFSSIIYTGFGTSGASVMALRSSDAIIFGAGGMTSILECLTAIEQNKPIGILRGPWDMDEVLRDLFKKNYPDYNNVITDDDPIRLLDQIIRRIRGQRNEYSTI